MESLGSGYLGSSIKSAITIEVYLPKNLQNYGALVDLLAEVLEFDRAKRWLVQNAGILYRRDRVLRRVNDQAFVDALSKGKARSIKEALDVLGLSVKSPFILTAAEGEKATYLLFGDGTLRYVIKVERSKQRADVCRPSIWRRTRYPIPSITIPLTPKNLHEGFEGPAELRKSLKRMRRTVVGYSISEADGAFTEGKGWKHTALCRQDAVTVTGREGKRLDKLLKESFPENGKEVCEEARTKLRAWLWKTHRLAVGKVVQELDAGGATAIGRKELMAISDSLVAKDIRLDLDTARFRPLPVIVVGEHLKAACKSKSSKVYAIYRRDRRYGAGDRDPFDVAFEVRSGRLKAESRTLDGLSVWEMTSQGVGVRIEREDGGEEGKSTSGFRVFPILRLIEERTVVVQFLVELGIPSAFGRSREDEGATGNSPNKQGNQGSRLGVEFPWDADWSDARKRSKRIWDAITLLGQFFVYKLGSRVGIEDEIWMTISQGDLGKWLRGTPVETTDDAAGWTVGDGGGAARVDTGMVPTAESP